MHDKFQHYLENAQKTNHFTNYGWAAKELEIRARDMLKIDESKDPPNQTPSMPIKGFLNLGGIKTFTLNKAKIETKKAGPNTHGRGNSK